LELNIETQTFRIHQQTHIYYKR